VHTPRSRTCLQHQSGEVRGLGYALCLVFDLGHRLGFDPVRKWASYHKASCSWSVIAMAYERLLQFMYCHPPCLFTLYRSSNFTSSFCNSNPQQLRLFFMISTMDQAYSWPHSAGFPLSIQTQSLTLGALYSPAAPPLRSGTSISSMSSLASFSSGSYGYGNDSPVLGGMGMAPGSHAQWSSVGSDTNTTKSPLERLGFKLNLTGEKKTRGLWSQFT
jgi:hypothetical protein